MRGRRGSRAITSFGTASLEGGLGATDLYLGGSDAALPNGTIERADDKSLFDSPAARQVDSGLEVQAEVPVTVSRERNKAMSNNHHIVPHGDQWAVKREGADRAGSLHGTQAEAVEVGRERAIRDSGELVIHDRHGRIRDKDSYGNDPNPPKDRKH